MAKVARLKATLKRRGISQNAVAKRAGVTKFHVSNVLAGRYLSAHVIRVVETLIHESLGHRRLRVVEHD